MLLLDLLLRFSALGLLLSLAFLSYRDRNVLKNSALLFFLCISLMALMLSTLPNELELSFELKTIIKLIDAPNTVLAWLFAKSLLKDDFSLDKPHIFLASLYCIAFWIMLLNGYFLWFSLLPIHWIILNLYALGLFAHLLVDIVQDWKNDLVESRRWIRLGFVCTITFLVGFLIAAEVFSVYISREVMNLFKVAVTFILTLAGHLWFLQITPRHVDAVAKYTQAADTLSDTERNIQQQLLRLVEDKEIWRDPNLTISILAGTIGIGEHKLRAFINHRLGYRNFSNYLQEYRLAAAKTLLADPSKRDTQILSLALDCGFNSISTFNRVFLKAEGVSPSAFRDARVSKKDTAMS